MMINSIGSYSNSSYTNYSMNNSANANRPPMDQKGNSKIDSNGNNKWNLQELEDFSANKSETIGASLSLKN